MKKLLLFIIITLTSIILSNTAFATYKFVVPQKPGGGTTVWAEIVSKELEKFLGEDIELVLIPGARDIPGFNEFHNNLQFDDKTIMVSHGGNGVSFLQEEVDYDYREYDSVGLMNLNIIVGKPKNENVDNPTIGACSGCVPEAIAITLLMCGPGKSVDEYISCFKDKVSWVSGMSTAERRLAFKRGELNVTRENPAAYRKHVASNDNAEVWFHHGLLEAITGFHLDDPNFPGKQLETLFKEKWGEEPKGEFYDTYKLVKSFRDGLQKALWIKKDSPYKNKIVTALDRMSADPASRKVFKEKVGNYQWRVGTYGDIQRNKLMTFITEPALKNLVKFNKEALGLASVYKPSLVWKKS